MKHKTRLKIWLAVVLVALSLLLGYKGYLLYRESDYEALNIDHIEQIEKRLRQADSYRFAVIGNIRNSMRIFERRLVPLFREQKIDFLISAGNAVFDGAEDKYRLLYRGLKKASIPYLIGVGENELEDFGAGKFYKHFGPYFFSFSLRNAAFLFLDSTGKTSWKWQLRWLESELSRAGDKQYRFVFMQHSPVVLADSIRDEEEIYLLAEPLSQQLRDIFARHRVSAVFSAGYPVYHSEQIDGVTYITSGSGGGLHLNPLNPYQFARVEVSPNGISAEDIPVTGGTGLLREKLETLKLFVHSLFYTSLFNALLAITFLGLAALRLYALIIRQEHLYRDFNVDEEALTTKQLRVAMFTNNYLPFIGGVPLSIDRLRQGLTRKGWKVRVFAPTYRQQWQDPKDSSVFRCPILLGRHIDSFPVVNIFSRAISREFNKCQCDLVHIHHPFWLGKKGMRLARKKGIPVVLTYHTRLEYYTHYLPLPGLALKNMAAHFVIKHFANNCDAIITPTPSTEEYLRNLGVSALVETIPTGINMETYASWSAAEVLQLRNRYVAQGEKLLITVARLAEEKNLDFLIDGLLKTARKSSRPFRCLLVGDGPERKRLEARVQETGMAKRIVFTGSLQPREVIRCYLAADLFVFASTSETQGMVLVEAMAGGCPVVAVRASGVYDVIKDEHNGFSVAESTDNWSDRVTDLLEEEEMLASMSQNSRAFARAYSVENIAQRVDGLYRRVMLMARTAD
jgi:glycosyltransferase involved in cell wall biosynthesis